jgi:hypothetical protein
LDDLDEAVRSEYKETIDPNDKTKKVYVLDIENPGVLPDVVRLTTSLSKERDAHKQTKTKFAPLAALGDIAELQAKLDRIPELEAAAEGKLDETKLGAIVESRLKSKLAPVERERDLLKTQVVELGATITGFQTEKKQRSIADHIRGAIGKTTGFQPAAVEDAIVFGERMLEVDDDGRVVTKDGVGVTPGVDATVWLTEMQTKKPHWWGPSAGGGARGAGAGNGGGGANPFTAEGWNMTAQGTMIRENRARAEQMAKSAGTTIGGPKPQAKK